MTQPWIPGDREGITHVFAPGADRQLWREVDGIQAAGPGAGPGGRGLDGPGKLRQPLGHVEVGGEVALLGEDHPPLGPQIEGRRQVRALMDLLRSEMPGLAAMEQAVDVMERADADAASSSGGKALSPSEITEIGDHAMDLLELLVSRVEAATGADPDPLE